MFQQGAGEIVDAGAIWILMPWLMCFGSLNTGLTRNLPSLAGQIGFVVAFSLQAT